MADVALHEIERAAHAALVAAGAREQVAGEVAAAVRTAESRGNKICGLYYLDSYCKQLESGRIDSSAVPEVHVERPGAVRVDAKFGFAQTAFAAGLEAALAAARTNGICGFSIEHSHTCTSLGYFTEQFAHAGMLAIGATNATPRVAPPGGSTALLGTNPIAMAVPDGEGGVAFQFDFSTSAVALGKITMAEAAGESIPIGWAVDSDGNDTTDPTKALAGSMLSAGGYKGYGLGLMVEVLAAALTGSLLSTEMTGMKTPEGPHHNIGQFYLVVDPNSFDGDGFWDRLEGIKSAVAAQPGARLPGTTRDDVDSVDLEDAVWASVLELAL